ncbi:hypothetical protein [Catenovulum sediminis]|uniref:hypothetical protein n=1 Tax=Catenovulum sediminis TaxID=1740262 RepID=UPI00163D9ECE|nr:hypothetical protein [Catenovulum sediminis]
MGGGPDVYHTGDLLKLAAAVDFISVHTTAFSHSYYEGDFWLVPEAQEKFAVQRQVDAAMQRALDYTLAQYHNTVQYIKKAGIDKPVHIGRVDWASQSDELFGQAGSKAADEYKAGVFHQAIERWSLNNQITAFYYQPFDTHWHHPNPANEENNFGLINTQGQVKFALWALYEQGVFEGLTRAGKSLTKTHQGQKKFILNELQAPDFVSQTPLAQSKQYNQKIQTGDAVKKQFYVLTHQTMTQNTESVSYPSRILKFQPWHNTSEIGILPNGVIKVKTGSRNWWGGTVKLDSSKGENLSDFKSGSLHFEIKGDTSSTFNIGFRSGDPLDGTLVNNFIQMGPKGKYPLTQSWIKMSIPLSQMDKGANFKNVTEPLYFLGVSDFDGKHIYIKNLYYAK